MNKYIPFATLLLLCHLTYAESGVALKPDTLRTDPFADAKVTGNLARNDKLDILEKKGAWLRVKSAKSTGWVRLLSVRRGEIAKTNETAGVLSVASGRAGTGQVVSTTGVRGLNEEELKAAQFNEAEISRLERAGISSDEARSFARSGNLNAKKIDYLPTPEGQ